MTKLEIEAKLEDLTNAIDNLYSKLGMPSWNQQKRQAINNAQAAAHESAIRAGGRA